VDNQPKRANNPATLLGNQHHETREMFPMKLAHAALLFGTCFAALTQKPTSDEPELSHYDHCQAGRCTVSTLVGTAPPFHPVFRRPQLQKNKKL
jgi:hypothetical protein